MKNWHTPPGAGYMVRGSWGCLGYYAYQAAGRAPSKHFPFFADSATSVVVII